MIERAYIENTMYGLGAVFALVGIASIFAGTAFEQPWRDLAVHGGLGFAGVGALLVLLAPSAEDDI